MSVKDEMRVMVGLETHHVEMIGEIIAGAGIQCDRPGNVAIGVALRAASRLATRARSGVRAVEFVAADGSRETLDIDRLFKP